jgi:hypothetical protein
MLLGRCLLMWAAKQRGLHNVQYTEASGDCDGHCEAYREAAFDLGGVLAGPEQLLRPIR